MITRRHFLSSCAVTAATPCAVSAQTITNPFNITVTNAAVATPSLIQMVSSTTNNPAVTGDTGNNFKFFLPNAVGAGNCLVLAITYPNGVTPIITDNNSNTWPTSPAATANAGSGNCISSIFVLPNANAGVTRINVAF